MPDLNMKWLLYWNEMPSRWFHIVTCNGSKYCETRICLKVTQGKSTGRQIIIFLGIKKPARTSTVEFACRNWWYRDHFLGHENCGVMWNRPSGQVGKWKATDTFMWSKFSYLNICSMVIAAHTGKNWICITNLTEDSSRKSRLYNLSGGHRSEES